jgi:hypothetical protein
MVCIAGKFTGGNPELAINAIYFLSKLFVILSAASPSESGFNCVLLTALLRQAADVPKVDAH